MSESVGVGLGIGTCWYFSRKACFKAPKQRVPALVVPAVLVSVQLSSLFYLRQFLSQKTLAPLEAFRESRRGRKIAVDIGG